MIAQIVFDINGFFASLMFVSRIADALAPFFQDGSRLAGKLDFAHEGDLVAVRGHGGQVAQGVQLVGPADLIEFINSHGHCLYATRRSPPATEPVDEIQRPPQSGFDGFDGQAQASRSVLPP